MKTNITEAMKNHLLTLIQQEEAAKRYPGAYAPGRAIGYGFKKQVAYSLLDRGLVDVRLRNHEIYFHLTCIGRAQAQRVNP